MRCNNSPQLSLHRAGMIFSYRLSILLLWSSKIWHVPHQKKHQCPCSVDHSVTIRPCEPCGPYDGAPCCTSPVGSVSVLICSGGLVHLFGQSPRPLRAATAVGSGQPSLFHLAVCPHQVLEGRKQSGHSAYIHTHTHITHNHSE